ncbi:maltose ABC transporter permease MalF [Ideonella sp. 4Y11]|uniref:Maltose/maltodextrin transport system permease protein n=1 Tax=Ideonella aquatica TaxID=2824119 RepID=A0A940YVT4_9BURK|nr:maltose ABC transporter permease MalF [Ideonella aquatica]MBQ0960175.1 maltose ABC transporter permease MalF [Ideonella aquatica]
MSGQSSPAWRYLLPALAAAAVFVVFPMLYTLSLGFTNYSARNLLEFERARAQLLEERLVQPGSERAFTLHADGARWRVALPAEGAQAALVTAPLTLDTAEPRAVPLQPLADTALTPAATPAQVVERVPALRALQLTTPDGQTWSLQSLRHVAPSRPLYTLRDDGALVDTLTATAYRPDMVEGFFTSEAGDQLQPGFRVAVGWRHYQRIFSDGRFQEPFASVLLWTVAFSALTVLGVTALGLLLAVLLNWEALEGRALYRVVLFLPYAVPGFISILVFKGLFNQNLGEINLILNGLFGIQPAWFTDPALARAMLLFVNIWLGFPYMMVLCSGLIKAIPGDLVEASAVLGAGPLTHFRRVTLPLILKPLTPLLISAFAFNFNNFVLVSLLTAGGPDRVDTALPVGGTDILVSYTWRIAFQDSGQQFGLAAAISTVIFAIVAAITLVQMRFTRINDEPAR